MIALADIVITYGVPSEGFNMLAGHTLHMPAPMTAYTRDELAALLPHADAVLACTALDGELIGMADRLRLIVCYGAGYDNIDIAAASRRGVMVCNTPECVAAPTAELAVSLITSLARRVNELNARAREGASAFGMGKRMGTSLEGATLGVVGIGHIGARVADFGRVMGMRVLYTARAPKPEREALGDRFAPLDELMRQSDFISLHCPLTSQTRGLISRDMLALMKPTAYIVNTSRGAVVDEAALINALRENRIAGAGLDVYVNEPYINPEILALKNVVLTPHVGSNTTRARRLMAEAASRRILDMLDGRTPEGLLNGDML